jgi:shikimate kinase
MPARRFGGPLMASRSVILLGLRCSGKSTVGPLLAERLGVEFADLDVLTAEVMGQPSAADAIRACGLETFRDGEVEALWRVLTGDTARRGSVRSGRPAALILALGGGTPTAPGAEAILKSAAARDWFVVYLRASVATLRARMERTVVTTRPSLTGRPPADEIAILHGQRDGLYRSLAELSLEVDELSAEQAAAWICGKLEH